MRQIQNLAWFPSIGFVFLMFSMNSCGFQAPQWIGRFLLILFAAIAWMLGTCMVEIERDPILSRIAGTEPGKLNTRFYVKLARCGALPSSACSPRCSPPSRIFSSRGSSRRWKR